MTTRIEPITEKSISEAKEILLHGGIIGMPTETVYGLAAVGTDSVAVKKIYEVKGRPSDNPLIAHIHKDYDLNKLVYIDNDYATELFRAYSPGPLTLVFRSKGVICREAVCGGDDLSGYSDLPDPPPEEDTPFYDEKPAVKNIDDEIF